MIQFWVAGTPKASPRPRRAKNGHFYVPPSADDWKERIMWRAREAGIKKPLIGAVKVTLAFVLRAKGREGDPHTSKPDCDNLEKSALDAMTAIGAWNDDAQVFDLHTVKRTGEAEGLLITIEESL